MRLSRKASVALFSMVLCLVSSVCLIPLFATASHALPKLGGKKKTETASEESSKKAEKVVNPIVVMETNKGVIKVEIYKEDAPKTAANFLDLVNRGFYNGLSFHRYEPGFCIQGGDPLGNGTGGFTDPKTGRERTIPLESSNALITQNPKLKHSTAGVLAMARSSAPDSASSQFYFTLAPAEFLDGKYAVFGKTIDGLAVVKELRKGDKMTKVYLQK